MLLINQHPCPYYQNFYLPNVKFSCSNLKLTSGSRQALKKEKIKRKNKSFLRI